MAQRQLTNLSDKRQRVRQAIARGEGGSRVRDVMTPHPLTVDQEQFVFDLFPLFEQHRIEHLLVVADGRLAGILRDRDMARLFSVDECEARSVRQLRARDLMGTNPPRIAPAADLAEAARMMVEGGVHCLPVTEEGRPVGVVTTTDLLLALETLVGQAD